MATKTSWTGKLKKLLSGVDAKALSRIEVHHDVGFGNALYIRGEGAGLSWDKGQPLNNTSADVWAWETGEPFKECTFKILINDVQYEQGENHTLPFGGDIRYTPRF